MGGVLWNIGAFIVALGLLVWISVAVTSLWVQHLTARW